jgi:hypothetical protein
MSVDNEGMAREGDRRSAAGQIYKELRSIQTDPIKASITGFGVGSAFYPQPDGKIVEVHIAKLKPLDPEASNARWKQGGFSDLDLKSGIYYLYEGKFEDPQQMYSLPGSMLPRDVDKRRWVSGAGAVLRPVEGSDSSTRSYEKEELDPLYADTLKRVGELSALPGKIKEEFGSYGAFKEALGKGVDMNGFDPHSWIGDDTQDLWLPFRSEKYLAGFIDALHLADRGALDSVDSSDHVLRTSVDGKPHRM